MAEITLLDNLEESNECLPIYKDQKKSLKVQLLEMVAKEETHWRQKCKTIWFIKGDLNSHFHKMVATGGKIRLLKSCLLMAQVFFQKQELLINF